MHVVAFLCCRRGVHHHPKFQSVSSFPAITCTPRAAAEMFIDAVDFQRHAITKDEFRELIMHMAAADLHSRRSAQQQVRLTSCMCGLHAVCCRKCAGWS